MLEELKTYLRIIGSNDDTYIQSSISRGKARLNGLVGVTLDYDAEGLPKSLLFDYCRYDYNNATEYFEENFAREILKLQLVSAVSDYAKNQS